MARRGLGEAVAIPHAQAWAVHVSAHLQEWVSITRALSDAVAGSVVAAVGSVDAAVSALHRLAVTSAESSRPLDVRGIATRSTLLLFPSTGV